MTLHKTTHDHLLAHHRDFDHFVQMMVRMPLSVYSEGSVPRDLEEFTHFSEHCRFTPEYWSWMVEQTGFEVEESLTRNSGKHFLAAAIRR